ncbi:hypothetical protein ACSBR2_024331 [Camellia fascicularis]
MANGGGNATGSGNSSSKKPHAVFIPFPLQGHITPLLKLAKLFHHRGFQITFVNAAFIHRRLLKSSAAGALTSPSSSSVADFRFETIPDGLHFGDDEEISPQLMYFICEASRYNFLLPFRHLVSKLNHEDSVAAPVTCIVSDAHMAFPITVAQEIGVPSFLFWPNSACGFMSIKHHNLLKQRSLIPLKDELADTIVDWIPGLKDIRLKDVPFAEIDKYDFPMREMEEAYKASGIIFNTFDILEQDVLDAISAIFPHVYTIGPLQLLLNSTSDDGLKSIGCSLWEEESECLQWLNSMKPNSVVYISFGSVAVMEPQQLTEFAWGIVNSNQPFLWIIRPNLVMGEAAALPPELLEKIKGRGMIAKWCQQEQVIRHPSVGGFLTHCGWNSTLDSLCAEVPILCWPWLGDQCINRRYSCTHWGIGIEMNKDVKRDEVEKLVRNLMEGEQGKELKKKVVEWKKLAVEATRDGGSSFMNLEKLVNEVLG